MRAPLRLADGTRVRLTTKATPKKKAAPKKAKKKAAPKKAKKEGRAEEGEEVDQAREEALGQKAFGRP